MKKEQFIKKAVEIIDNEISNNNFECMQLHNIYVSEICNDTDNEIFELDEEFFNMFFEGKAFNLVQRIKYGDVELNHNFIKFDGYGNLESLEYPSDYLELSENIAGAIYENPSLFEYINTNLDDLINEI
jgi:hypothetical protein